MMQITKDRLTHRGRVIRASLMLVILCVVPLSAAPVALGEWTLTGSLAENRFGHTATLLPSGSVLAAGGYNGSTLASAELYDRTTGTWSATGAMNGARDSHTATLLTTGKVLIAGGFGSIDKLRTAELL